MDPQLQAVIAALMGDQAMTDIDGNDAKPRVAQNLRQAYTSHYMPFPQTPMGAPASPQPGHRPQPAPSPLRRNQMMQQAQQAGQQPPDDPTANLPAGGHPAALIQIAEQLDPAYQAMLQDLSIDERRSVLARIAQGLNPDEAFTSVGYTQR